MSVRIMDSNRFEELKRCAADEVSKLRAEGNGGNILRCWMIGFVTGTNEMPDQLAFTAGQLAELFQLTFLGGQGQNEEKTLL